MPLPQTLMPPLFPPTQIIRCVDLPLYIRRPQIKVLKLLWMARLRVGGNISRHPFLPNRLANRFRPVRLATIQLVGGVDPPQKILRRQLPLQVFHPGQAGALAPGIVLFIVHGNQFITFIRCGVLPA